MTAASARQGYLEKLHAGKLMLKFSVLTLSVATLIGCASPEMRPVSATEKHVKLSKAVTLERFWGFASLPPGNYQPVAEIGDFCSLQQHSNNSREIGRRQLLLVGLDLICRFWWFSSPLKNGHFSESG